MVSIYQSPLVPPVQPLWRTDKFHRNSLKRPLDVDGKSPCLVLQSLVVVSRKASGPSVIGRPRS